MQRYYLFSVELFNFSQKFFVHIKAEYLQLKYDLVLVFIDADYNIYQWNLQCTCVAVSQLARTCGGWCVDLYEIRGHITVCSYFPNVRRCLITMFFIFWSVTCLDLAVPWYTIPLPRSHDDDPRDASCLGILWYMIFVIFSESYSASFYMPAFLYINHMNYSRVPNKCIDTLINKNFFQADRL